MIPSLDPFNFLGTILGSDPVPGIFSLPGILCLILGALLFLVLIILGTQLHRWRADHRALSRFRDALDEAVYQEIDYLGGLKEEMLDSPGSWSDNSVSKLPYYTRDDEENGDLNSMPEPPHQGADALRDGYDDAEELPIMETPPVSQMSEGEIPPEEKSVRTSQAGSSLRLLRGAAEPRKGEDGSWLLPGEERNAGYDDVELSAPGTSVKAFP
ncbi:antigen WC1.1-like [Otolemur garnettii]|uniref:antigen WC1.1-like n=1 Tax=Otolemur garnettii TaxID=30611 RepID=UPI000C7EDB62|nr:antigen WC1.1-like [Otolemur garnettii]